MAAASLRASNEAPRPRAQDIDRSVGARMRERRMMLGLTQQQMAELIGVTYQQAHKYETGINRISAGRLYQIAQALGRERAGQDPGQIDDPDPLERARPAALLFLAHFIWRRSP